MPPSKESLSGLGRRLLNPQSSNPGSRGRWITFLIVLFAGSLISWFLFDIIAKNAASSQTLAFEREASQIEARLQTQFDLSLEYLLAIPPLFQVDDLISPQDFAQFVMGALKRHSAIYAVEYLLKVPAGQIKAVETEATTKWGMRDFKIHAVNQEGDEIPLPVRDDYFPIYFGEPAIHEVLGVDLASHPEQGQYVEKARSSKSAIASHILSLIEDRKDELSVLALAPIRPAHSQDTTDCLGIAVLILKVRPVVEIALGETRLNEFQLTLTDPDAAKDKRVVYQNFPGESLAQRSPRWPNAARTIRFADQAWDFRISPAWGSEFAPSRPPYWILLAGLALSGLAAYSLSATVEIGGLRKQVDEALELGQYRLGRMLGEGGMGIVYQAQHRMLARPAAIKLILFSSTDSETVASTGHAQRLSRFEKEAKATASLESPHTISIYDYGKTPNGDFYYVMELLHGTDLSTLIKEFGPISPARMVHLIRQVCQSLKEAHQAGLIHRDIKPANIFNCKYAGMYDFVKVLDFGLVKSSDREQSIEITQPGALLGTPAFIAPEMLIGGDVDHRVDIYSLGCVMFWLLVGKTPFTGPSATAVMAKHLNTKAESVRKILKNRVPEELDAIVASCLEKQPDKRPQSAEALDQLLGECAKKMPWTQDLAERCWKTEESKRKPLQQDFETGPSESTVTISITRT